MSIRTLIGETTGLAQATAQIAGIVGVDLPTPPVSNPPSEWIDWQNVYVGNMWGLFGGGIAGAMLWQDHPVLGVFAGGALGSNGPSLLNENERKAALRSLLAQGTAVGASLYMGSNSKLLLTGQSDWIRATVGYIGGYIVGQVAGMLLGLPITATK